MIPIRVRAQPCVACPYRRDVPSGVWSEDEYEKLMAYDDETMNQPIEWFGCHATPEFSCHGWAVVHSNRGHEHELLALRMFGADHIPEPTVPLFASGLEAAIHGLRDIENPSEAAHEVMRMLMTRYERLRDQAPGEECPTDESFQSNTRSPAISRPRRPQKQSRRQSIKTPDASITSSDVTDTPAASSTTRRRRTSRFVRDAESQRE